MDTTQKGYLLVRLNVRISNSKNIPQLHTLILPEAIYVRDNQHNLRREKWVRITAFK